MFDSKTFISQLTSEPGVYKMLNSGGAVIYVGKAKNLKKRVGSYFRKNLPDSKTQSLVEQIASIDIIVTRSETEALILENNLIKAHKPKYNVIFRDDKGYPYIYLSDHQPFPKFSYYRGAKKSKGRYYGPYPSSNAVREALKFIQKIFRVRQCDDVFFKNRTRPCLQYQIKRCSGPCVGLIDEMAYRQDVHLAKLFLEGKAEHAIGDLTHQMELASIERQYERAALLRDQIINLRKVQEKQYVEHRSGNTDVVAVVQQEGVFCVEILYIRGGQLIGHKSHFPSKTYHHQIGQIAEAFLEQHYLPLSSSDIPTTIIVDQPVSTTKALSEMLTERAGKQVFVTSSVKGVRHKWVEIAQTNASAALRSRSNLESVAAQRSLALKLALMLEETPVRVECFDVSHTQGEATVASCVVFDNGLPNKKAYRRYNITNVEKGDDYGAMFQAVYRRYKKVVADEEAIVPDVILIDGGKGQVSRAKEALEEAQLSGVMLVGVAKGPERKAGLERLYLGHKAAELRLDESSEALHLIQHIRDEAHRFAITGHRSQRQKKRNESILDGIDGIGPAKRRALLNYFGGLQEVKKATAEELCKVPGISRGLAHKIIAHFKV